MNIIMLDDQIGWLYEEVYKDHSWQCRQTIMEELFSSLEDIRQKGYERSLSSKFKIDKFVDIYCFSYRESSSLYLPFYQSLVKH